MNKHFMHFPPRVLSPPYSSPHPVYVFMRIHIYKKKNPPPPGKKIRLDNYLVDY